MRATHPLMKTLDSIQYLRALAALGVVVFHACQWRGLNFNVGRAGVDLFFIISGVIMWRVTGGRQSTPRAFLWRRITRVAPFYWLVTLVVAAAVWFRPQFLPNVSPRLDHLLLSLAFIPHLGPFGLPFPLLPPGWTLDYEALFYLVFAAALFAPRRRQAAIVCGALLAIIAAGVILPDPVYILIANPLLAEFAVGIGIALLAEHRALPGPIGGLALLTVGVLLLGVPAALGLFSELGRPFIWGPPGAFIVAGALALEQSGAMPRWPALARLGDASYALYLVHVPVVAIVAAVAAKLQLLHVGVFAALAVVASVVVALAAHGLVEGPLINLCRGWPRPSQPQTVASARRG